MSESQTAADDSEVIQTQIDAIRGVESLADTPFSKLFHEARTAGRNYSGVALQVRITDGEIEAHSEPVKTRQGEHLRGTDAWDTIITLPTKTFMEVRTARQEIVRQLKAWLQNVTAKEARQ